MPKRQTHKHVFMTKKKESDLRDPNKKWGIIWNCPARIFKDGTSNFLVIFLKVFSYRNLEKTIYYYKLY